VQGPTPSLRRYLVERVLWTTCLPMLLLGAALAAGSWHHLMGAAERDTATLADASASTVLALLESRREPVRLLTLTLRDQRAAVPDMRDELALLVAGGAHFDAAYVADVDGRVAAAALAPGAAVQDRELLGLDLRSNAWFEQARRTSEPVWTNTFQSLATGRSTAVLASGLGAGRVLAVEIALPRLAASLASRHPEGTDFVALLDGRGRVVGHPDPQRAARQDDFGQIPLVRQALAQGRTRGEMQWDGRRWMASLEPVAGTNWVALAARPHDELLRPLLALALVFAGAMALALLLAFGGARRLAQAESARHGQLLQAARQSTRGHAAPAPSFGIAEFEALWAELHGLIDRLRASETEAHAARRRLQEIFDATSEVAIIATDLQGRVTTFNRGAEKLLQHDSHEMVGRAHLLDWHVPDDLLRRAEELRQLTGEHLQGLAVLTEQPRRLGFEVREALWRRRDGHTLTVAEAITLTRDADDVPSGYLAVASDLSEHHRAERAAAADRAKSEMLSRVSHELRTPLNAVLGFAQLLSAEAIGELNEAQRGKVASILGAGWHLLGIIDDLLDLSRIEAGALRVRRERVALGALLEQAASLLEDPAHGEGVKLVIEPTAADLAAWADAERLRQVLVNLISNAIKYNRRGGWVRVRARPASAAGNAAAADERVLIEVEDNGLGLSEEQQARLFEPFNRLGRERGSARGTGIGLVIVKQLTEAMGGQLALRSQAGAGSCFAVALPRALKPGPEPHAAATPAAAPRAAADAPLHDVVLIEDNEVNVLIVEAVLRARPACRLQVRHEGRAGLELARAVRPALVLLDMNLPDIDGPEVLRQLRADPVLGEVPVIVLSADANEGSVQRARAAGASEYLFKPIDSRDLLRAVDQTLGMDVRA
jgi:PAS domain S-box-containing protein